jgi:K+-sensing histidine kinase KdpD
MLGRSANSLCNLAAAEFAERHEFISMSFNLALYTTKAVGKGTGMGMSISHQVITERHKGRLQCLSSPENGATFVIEIPIRQTPTGNTGLLV